MTRLGTRFECQRCGAKALIVAEGAGDAPIACCGEDQPSSGGPSQLGKRYQCAACRQTVLCLTAGPGGFCCHGAPMEPLAAEQLPSGD
jgi:hypothetical protein